MVPTESMRALQMTPVGSNRISSDRRTGRGHETKAQSEFAFRWSVDRRPFPVRSTEGSVPPIGEAKPGERERDDAERRHGKERRPGIGSI